MAEPQQVAGRVVGCLLVVDRHAGEPDLSLMATEMMGMLGPSSCRVSRVITAEMRMTPAPGRCARCGGSRR